MNLICQESLAVFKEYNLRRHFKTNHDGYGSMDMEVQLLKVKQTLATAKHVYMNSQSEGAVKASFIIAEETARELFTEGEFIKNCI